MTKKTLFWLRNDLRVSDNPALYEAAKNGPVMIVYILDDESAQSFKMGSASRWWLYHSLLMLNGNLENKLNVYKGHAIDIILNLIQIYQFDAVYWNRCYEPWRIQDDGKLKARLKESGIECKSFNASLLWEPMEVLKSDETPYKIFTSYAKQCQKTKSPRQPLPRPEKLSLIKDFKNRAEVRDLDLLPSIKWYSFMESHWVIGEEGAHLALSKFLENGLQNYQDNRDFPAKNNVSRLSPYLHFGEISPHQIWQAVQAKTMNNDIPLKDTDHFLRELSWREFSYYLLYHFPNLPRQNLQRKFDKFPWKNQPKFLEAWQQGQTGYPIVDAGMRELWKTGYMHNRVRMIVGSFLVKNLLIHWHCGEDWFWDCLVDADLASNSASWQWVAGSGTDATPYFRIFNPITQGEKFDPEGTYIREFIPELALLPNKYLFKPWEAPIAILKTAGIVLGETYPKPIVDLKASRQRALEAFSMLQKT
jgi:deoxyribodipyrimidine photo-lyase